MKSGAPSGNEMFPDVTHCRTLCHGLNRNGSSHIHSNCGVWTTKRIPLWPSLISNTNKESKRHKRTCVEMQLLCLKSKNYFYLNVWFSRIISWAYVETVLCIIEGCSMHGDMTSNSMIPTIQDWIFVGYFLEIVHMLKSLYSWVSWNCECKHETLGLIAEANADKGMSLAMKSSRKLLHLKAQKHY